MKILTSFDGNTVFWDKVRENLKDFKFKDFDFLFTFIEELKNLSKSQSKLLSFKDVWVYFLKQLSDPSWTFYYMIKLDEPSLINIH